MKKLSLAFIFAFVSCASLYAQTPDWQWAKTAGSSYNDFCQAIAIDTNGNIYTTGFGGGGLTFPNVIIVYSGPIYYGEQSMVNLGGGNFLILARDNTKFSFHQFKSEDNCQTWTFQGITSFEGLTLYPSPPWLSFINYEGVGIVACYYTNRGTQKMNVVFGLAKDLLDIGPSAWVASTIKEIIYFNGSKNSGYQSFFLPLNQYKGIGVGFKETGGTVAYPIVVFTNIQGMQSVLGALGL